MPWQRSLKIAWRALSWRRVILLGGITTRSPLALAVASWALEWRRFVTYRCWQGHSIKEYQLLALEAVSKLLRVR